ncbi:transducin beta-like protein 3 [Tetranychus urticae]|uniref:U3 small nucleolar RNA-associated protein 13 C-terminal domain-containing protein n=1 Tax=Tetranychus urticae TaxID=32264 RepID=T1KBK5_TETUR|nr:transducin beta-like protein 3 [Tetranychus urticae]
MKFELKESFKVQSRIHPSFTNGFLKVDESGTNLLSSSGNAIKIESINDGSEVATIKEKVDSDIEDEVIDFVTGYHDGVDKVYAAYRSGLLKEWSWNSEGATLRRTWRGLHTGPMSTLAISDGGKGNLLATGSSDTIVKVWDVIKQYCTHHLKGCRGVISCIQFYTKADKTELIAASGDLNYSVNVWKLADSQLISNFVGHCSRVIGLQFYSHDEKNLILSASRDMLAIVWSIDDGTSLRKIPLFEAVESMILLPDNAIFGFIGDQKPKGKVFLTGGPKGIIKAWDTSSGACLFTQSNSILANDNQNENQTPEMIIQCLLHPDLNKLLVVSYERNILFYDLQSFELVRQAIGNIDQVSDIKFIGPAEKHIVVATNSPNMTIFHIETMESSIIKGHSGIVLSLQVYPTNKTLFASSSKDNDIRLWSFNPNTMSAQCLYIASGHSLSVITLAVPFKSTNWLFSASEDTTMKVWKIPTKIKVEPDSKEIHLSTLETVKAHDKDINGLAIAPNDKFIASCSQDRTAKLWSFDKNLSLAGTLKGHRRGIWSIAFSPVDVIVATASADTTIKLWSLNDFSCLKTLQSHESSVLNFVFVNRGMQIISSSSDGNVKLWTVKTGECSTTLDAHAAKIWALTASEDEKLLVTGGEDSQIIVWKDDTVEKKEEEAKKEELFMANEQKLMNLIQQQKWTKALKLAIKLEQPFRALNIVKEILFTTNQDQLQVLESSLKGLREDQLVSLLKYAINWNTNSKNSEAAQYIFRVTLNFLGLEGILNLPESKEIVEGFLSYTSRHMNRINKLSEQISVINFLYSNIKLDN